MFRFCALKKIRKIKKKLTKRWQIGIFIEDGAFRLLVILVILDFLTLMEEGGQHLRDVELLKLVNYAIHLTHLIYNII
jgi:hypothetical protein